MLLGSQDEECPSRGIPTCSAPHPMHISVLALRQMVMDDIVDVGYVETTRCKVGAYEDVGRAITEALESRLALFLLHAAMEVTYRKPLPAKMLGSALHTVAIVEEHHRTAFAERAQQQ